MGALFLFTQQFPVPWRMNASVESIPNEVARRPKPLEAVGSHAASGALWTVLFSALNKCLAMASQIVTARLLLPDEFGLVAITLSVEGLEL